MDTQHSVPLTLQALSAECEHRVWSHVPVSPDDLWPLSLSLPLTRACLASESIFPVTLNLKSDPAGALAAAAGAACAGTKTLVQEKIAPR